MHSVTWPVYFYMWIHVYQDRLLWIGTKLSVSENVFFFWLEFFNAFSIYFYISDYNQKKRVSVHFHIVEYSTCLYDWVNIL